MNLPTIIILDAKIGRTLTMNDIKPIVVADIVQRFGNTLGISKDYAEKIFEEYVKSLFGRQIEKLDKSKVETSSWLMRTALGKSMQLIKVALVLASKNYKEFAKLDCNKDQKKLKQLIASFVRNERLSAEERKALTSLLMNETLLQKVCKQLKKEVKNEKDFKKAKQVARKEAVTKIAKLLQRGDIDAAAKEAAKVTGTSESFWKRLFNKIKQYAKEGTWFGAGLIVLAVGIIIVLAKKLGVAINPFTKQFWLQLWFKSGIIGKVFVVVAAAIFLVGVYLLGTKLFRLVKEKFFSG